jgi:peroxisome-assembly ATPase
MRRLVKSHPYHRSIVFQNTFYWHQVVRSFGTIDKEKEFNLISVYESQVQKADIKIDQIQLKAIRELDRLSQDLKNYNPPLSSLPMEQESTSWWTAFTSSVRPVKTSTPPPKGVYLHGGVGCGKTFSMNLFYQSLLRDDKQIVHFQKFMLRVHQQMHEAKRIEGVIGDVLPRVIQRTLQQGRILCFDEFQVTDVADAMILTRLFTGLIEQGAVIVATSNRPPDDLYLNGVQRDRFLPFISFLKNRLNVVSMWESETDYRLVNRKAKGVYFIGNEARQDFEETFFALTESSSIIATNLSTQGRLVPIPRACMTKGVARFAFEDLCTKALGAADYLVIGQHFHTVFVDRIPVMTIEEVNWVRRFIIFVDSMYESQVKLIIHANSEPEGIFEVDFTNTTCDEKFAFDRTRSRLEEMRSQKYLQKRLLGRSTSDAKNQMRVEPSLSENMP